MDVRNMTRPEILMPVHGTTRWVDGKASGVWGIDVPCTPHVRENDGQLRPLTRAERRWLDRLNRRAAK